MAVELPTVAAPDPPTSAAAGEPAPDFDERWAAWQAKGAAHHRAVRRRLAIAAPILVLLIAALLYVLVGR
jgi:hypothetical protein